MIARKPWGQPQEISAMEWPSRGRRYGLGVELLVDLALRLEQTPRTKAIAVPFDTLQEAQRMRDCLYKRSYVKFGRGYISFATGHRTDGTPALFVRRGPNWGKGNMDEKLKRQEAGNGRDA